MPNSPVTSRSSQFASQAADDVTQPSAAGPERRDFAQRVSHDSPRSVHSLLDALRRHWPEYLMEAAGLGLFMISACVFGTLLEHPASPVRQAIESALLRRVLMGLAMGGTAITLIYSPWGKQSGAHLNPAVTLTFFRLGKVAGWDAVFYGLSQFVGGTAGVVVVALVLGNAQADPAVHYVVTAPGRWGDAVAFLGEVAITFVLMAVVLVVSNSAPLARYTGLFAGSLVATYITFEAPLSGMSMNPARTFASAVAAHDWTALWIYFTAPPLGMLAAAQVYLRLRGRRAVSCAKLHHQNTKRCIFCEHQQSLHAN
jgi:aquaporin Z